MNQKYLHFVYFQVPLQENFSDCGLYVLQYFESFFTVSIYYILLQSPQFIAEKNYPFSWQFLRRCIFIVLRVHKSIYVGGRVEEVGCCKGGGGLRAHHPG